MECKNLTNCAFIHCCKTYDKDKSVNGFVKMYCKGTRMNECVRFKLSSKFGKGVVPANMMPNGYPLPGTTKEGWSEQAQMYYKYTGQSSK